MLLVFAIVLSFVKGSWWYDTCLVYVAGSYFAFYKKTIENVVGRYYAKCIIVFGVGFIISYLLMNRTPSDIRYLAMNVCSIFFAFFIVLVCFKVKLNSTLLEWSGKNLFPLYIYQRLPMILFASIMGGSLVVEYRYCYVVVCMLVAILITILYKYIAIRL